MKNININRAPLESLVTDVGGAYCIRVGMSCGTRFCGNWCASFVVCRRLALCASVAVCHSRVGVVLLLLLHGDACMSAFSCTLESEYGCVS